MKNKKNRIITIILVVLSAINLVLAVLYFLPEEEPEVVVEDTTTKSINIKKLGLIMYLGEEQEISAESKNNSLKWESSDKKIVDVTSCTGTTCKIKALSLGEATITVRANNDYDTIKIKVNDTDTIRFYKYKNYDYYYFDSENTPVDYLHDGSYDKVGEYKCTSMSCSGLKVNKTFAVVKDNEVTYEYNYVTKTSTKAPEILNDYEYYTLISNSKEVLGYVLDNNKLYSSEQNKIIENNFSYAIVNSILDEDNIVMLQRDESTIMFINIKTNKLLGTATGNANNISKKTIDDKKIYELNSYYNTNTTYLDTNFKPLFEGKTFYISNIINNKLYAINKLGDQKVDVYQSNGILEKTYEFDKALDIFDKYILAVDTDKNINLIDQYGEVVTKVDTYGNYYYHHVLSGYKDSGYGDSKIAGYYMIFGNDDLKYGTDGAGIIYSYDGNKVTKTTNTGIGGYGKPILYLYPTKKTKVTVTFDNPQMLTTTYPKFNKSWKVTAKPDGSLYDSNNRYYYGLYWEENLNHNVTFNTGFYVTSDNAIDFLEEKLEILGFTERESNEFITYWLPILEKNKQSLVYFELTQEREAYNRLIINPKPDSLLRVAIHVKKVNKYQNIKEEKLPTFERKGFVAVEWGGVIYE